jgi:chaperonin GroES
MAKDSLAQGARSAVFSAGSAERDEPIEFHGTVAEEEGPRGTVFLCGICGETEEPCRHVDALSDESAVVVDFSRYQPMNDRVLLRRVDTKNEQRIQMPEAFVQDSDIGEVIAVGEGMLIGGELRPINLQPGDQVRFGHYNAEDITVEGVKLILVSAFDIRLKIRQ